MVCLVCGAADAEPHFGAISCRACAAFFRRYFHSTKGIVSCTCSNRHANSHPCRECRIQKCLAIGMKRTKVQLQRGQRENKNKPVQAKCREEQRPSPPSLAVSPVPYPAKHNAYYDTCLASTSYSEMLLEKCLPDDPVPTTSDTPEPRVCAICNRPTTLLNCEVLCCKACKVFYERSLTCKRPKVCNCNKSQKYIPHNMCGYCRYQRCMKVGLKSKLAIEQKMLKSSESFSEIINNLFLLDTHRQELFLNYHASGDLSLEHAFREPIKFLKKPESMVFNFSDWSSIEQLTTVNYLKQLEFVPQLPQEDQTRYFKNACFSLSVFLNAFRNYTAKRGLMSYPDHSDCPEGTYELCNFSEEFMTRIQCKLVGRMIELQISEEEFLLLSVLLFCDPVLKRTIKDIGYFFVIYQMRVVKKGWRAVFVESAKSVALA